MGGASGLYVFTYNLYRVIELLKFNFYKKGWFVDVLLLHTLLYFNIQSCVYNLEPHSSGMVGQR